jgi:hypothetical protein
VVSLLLLVAKAVMPVADIVIPAREPLRKKSLLSIIKFLAKLSEKIEG